MLADGLARSAACLYAGMRMRGTHSENSTHAETVKPQERTPILNWDRETTKEQIAAAPGGMTRRQKEERLARCASLLHALLNGDRSIDGAEAQVRNHFSHSRQSEEPAEAGGTRARGTPRQVGQSGITTHRASWARQPAKSESMTSYLR